MILDFNPKWYYLMRSLILFLIAVLLTGCAGMNKLQQQTTREHDFILPSVPANARIAYVDVRNGSLVEAFDAIENDVIHGLKQHGYKVTSNPNHARIKVIAAIQKSLEKCNDCVQPITSKEFANEASHVIVDADKTEAADQRTGLSDIIQTTAEILKPDQYISTVAVRVFVSSPYLTRGECRQFGSDVCRKQSNHWYELNDMITAKAGGYSIPISEVSSEVEHQISKMLVSYLG